MWLVGVNREDQRWVVYEGAQGGATWGCWGWGVFCARFDNELLMVDCGKSDCEEVSGGGSPALTARFHNELWTMDCGESDCEEVSRGGSPAWTARFHNDLWTMDPRAAEREDDWGGGSAERGSTTSSWRWIAGSATVGGCPAVVGLP